MRVTDRHVLFWNDWPSNFAPASFTWEYTGRKAAFSSSEQAFMWAKAVRFGDDETAARILSAGKPSECKALGRRVKGYDDAAWEADRRGVMLAVNLAKYGQNQDLLRKLTDPAFDGKKFVEASPYDRIWGIGLGENDPAADDEKRWRGRNLLGGVLDEVRSRLAVGKEG